MQSSTSTSIHHTQPTPLNIHRHRPTSWNGDIQDSNAAGRPFPFVPKRRSSSGSPGAKAAVSEDSTVSNSLKQGQIWLVEQPPLDPSGTPQISPHTFSALSRTRPELPPLDREVDGTTLAEVDTSGTTTPSTPVPPSVGSTFYIRKKSGELVKPSLKSTGFATWSSSSTGRARTKSAPTTPMGSKSVHFDAQLEHVKLFLAEQKPLAVSRDGSPTETSEGDTTDTSFPFPRMTSTTLRLKGIVMPTPPPEPWTFDVRLENLALEGTALVGQVLVRNVAFTKWVAVRFTLDAWQTTSEVAAQHIVSLHHGAFDRFEFRVRLVDYLNGIESKRIVLCIRFSVAGREMWDSNGGRNYEVGFEKVKEEPKTVPIPSGGRNGTPLLADLRKHLEKVAQDVQADVAPPAASAVHHKRPRGLRVWLGDRLLSDEEDASLHSGSRSPSPLEGQRSSSTPSLSNTDVPLSARYDLEASLRSPSWTPPLHTMPATSNSMTLRPRPIQRRVRSPSLSPSNSTASFQFPRAGQHRRTMTVPLDGSPTRPSPETSPQGSPRDSGDRDIGYSRHQDDDTCDEDRPRHHTRGWARDSSFEPFAAEASPVKMTSPGMPRVIPPTPPRQGAAFQLWSEESSSSSSCSPSVSPSTSVERVDRVWHSLSRDKDEASVSTPSFTSASSTPASLSPQVAPAELRRAASEDILSTSPTQVRSMVQRPPINSTPYYSFLDQCVFFVLCTVSQ